MVKHISQKELLRRYGPEPVQLMRFDNVRTRRYNPFMGVRGPALFLTLILMMSEVAVAQANKPLFLDNRPGEDPSVIDVTEITEQYSKGAVEEYEKGIAEARKGNRLAAREHLESAIRIDPKFFNAHNSLAILLHQMFQPADAEREYLEAAKLNPRSYAPYVNLASLHIEQAILTSGQDSKSARGLLNSALANLNKALEVQPGTPLAHYLTGVVYFMTSFYEESESQFKKAISTGGSRMIVARLALAEIYVKLQEWDGVVAQLDEYLDEFPMAPNRVRVRAARDAAAERLAGSNR
ncbi:MAG TPA: tetratricopeptide repeat protein [Terriglobia bacterium]|nr:tetratricopeptide repeat protein [Terriglobia bacterium]